MYSATIKLCQDNKINARNTWSLNLIDYMPMLFKQDSDTVKRTVSFQDDREDTLPPSNGDDTNFQLAGVTLDAGVKIYCSRVDSVHVNAFKVLGGLSRTGREDVDEDASSQHADADDPLQNNRKRRAKRAGGATLESNMANITSHKLEMDLAVDPLFQKMSAAFDEGGARGMLLNNLPVGPSAHIIFDSAEPADNLIASINEEPPSTATDATYDVSALLPPQPPDESDVICPQFLRFFQARKAGLDDTLSCVTSASQSMSQNSTQSSSVPYTADEDFSADSSVAVDFDYAAGDLENAASLGLFSNSETSQPIQSEAAGQFDAADDDDVNIFAPSERVSLQSNASLAFAAQGGRVDLVEAGVALRDDSAYSFFDASALAGWAGPQHWRFRATEASAQFGDAARKTEPKRPRGKTAMLLDFSHEAPRIDFESEFAPAKTASANHLSKSVRDAFSEKKVTLPEDLHFSARSLASLFLKPKTYIRPPRSHEKRGTGESAESNDAAGWYDFDNDCDNENFCPQDDQVGAFMDDDNENTHTSGDAFGTGIDLVAEPARVEKIDINYAKVAKKVDVRQLKSGLWSRLCGEDEVSEANTPHADTEDTENQTESMPVEESCGHSGGDIRSGASQTLQELVHDMPAFVPENALPDVSLSYVFICLLHLANEKTLSITQGGEGSIKDLVISSNVQNTE